MSLCHCWFKLLHIFKECIADTHLCFCPTLHYFIFLCLAILQDKIIIIIIPRTESGGDTNNLRRDWKPVKTISEASRSHGPWTLQLGIAEGGHFGNSTLLEEETDIAIYLILN
jgi:hypothetical protein